MFTYYKPITITMHYIIIIAIIIIGGIFTALNVIGAIENEKLINELKNK